MNNETLIKYTYELIVFDPGNAGCGVSESHIFKHFSRGICPQTPLYDHIIRAFGADSPLPCEQRLHIRCRSWRAKSSLCRQPFKSVLKSGRINLKKRGFFLFLTGLEHCVSLAWILRSRSELAQFFYSCETRAIWRQTWRLILLANRVTNFAHAR